MPRLFFAVLLLFLPAACTVSTVEHDPKAVFDDPEAYRVLQELVDLIKAKDVETFQVHFHPAVAAIEGAEEKVKDVFRYLPNEDEFEVTLYYAEMRLVKGERSDVPLYVAAYDVVGQERFAQMILTIAAVDEECCVVTSVILTPMEVRPSKAFDFTFEGKGLRHYIFFGLMIFLPLFILTTAIACAKNKNMRKKWLWIPFILFGLWGARFNWTTGDIQLDFIETTGDMFFFKIFSFKLLGGGFTKAGHFHPWIISVGFPVGAILYWAWPKDKKGEEGAEDS